MIRLASLALLLLLAAPVGWAEDEPSPPPGKTAEADEALRARVTAWLADLRSDDFATREAARAGLKREGPRALDLLEAAKDDTDAEVRRTVRAILAGAPRRVTPTAAEIAPGRFESLGTITYQGKDRPLSVVLAAVGEPVWGRVLVPERLAAVPVTAAFEKVPFFAALEELIGARDLVAPRPFDGLGRLALEARAPGVTPAPWAAAGPMRLRVTEVSAARSLGVKAPPKYALTLELAWTPHVQVSQVETPGIEVARDPDGKAYRPTSAMNRRVTYGVGGSQRHHVFTVHITPVEEDCKPVLAVLETRLTMNLRFDAVRVDFDATADLPQTKNGVTLHAIEAVEGGRGQYVVDFSAKLSEDVADRSLAAYVIEADGRPSTLGVYGGRSRAADGTVRIRARAYRGNRGAPPRIRVRWQRREERGSLRFRLTDIPLR